MVHAVEPIDVLIVEDDPSIGELIQIFLEGEGYSTRMAASGEAALLLVQVLRPRLILLDMNLPGVTGWDFAYAYQQMPEPLAPIVVMTAAGWAGQRAEQIGAAAALGKPFDIDDLLAIVQRYIDDRPQLRLVT